MFADHSELNIKGIESHLSVNLDKPQPKLQGKPKNTGPKHQELWYALTLVGSDHR